MLNLAMCRASGKALPHPTRWVCGIRCGLGALRGSLLGGVHLVDKLITRTPFGTASLRVEVVDLVAREGKSVDGLTVLLIGVVAHASDDVDVTPLPRNLAA